jgi:AbrB family transcriptional regulator (stage V sporulation protein T)
MVNRKQFFSKDPNDAGLRSVEGIQKFAIAALPIISAGDVTGAVVFLQNDDYQPCNENQTSLITAAAQFLGKQTEV